ncbi:HEAT repeat-containing protein 4 [Ambystoma mexicanum]|uniref:HEAT repeat-containing protein 4 n=1 Tax=Ambystoma mexicanum TaxID=8296 RepID=UPI0037E87070
MENPLLSATDSLFPASAVGQHPLAKNLSTATVTMKVPLQLMDLQRHSTHLQAEYLKNVASDLNFSKDVVMQRGLPSLPFQEWDARVIYDVSDLLPGFGKKGQCLKTSVKTDPPKHKLCQLKYAIPQNTKVPVRRSLNLGQGLFKPKVSEIQTPGMASFPSRKFVTEPPAAVPDSSKNEKSTTVNTNTQETSKQNSWEEAVLRKLTKNTAQWIVSHQAGHSVARDQLLLRYGFSSSINLIPEDSMREADFMTSEEQEAAARNHVPEPIKKKEPDMLLPVYYRLPSFCPPKTINDEVGSQNRTGDRLPMVHYEPPSPVRLQDVMNPLAGKYVYSTDNPFEHELYSGSARIVHQRDEWKKDCILMENLNEYNKHLQETFPKPPGQWSFAEADKVLQKPERRALRWTALPSPVDTQAEMQPAPKITREKHPDREVRIPQELQLIKNMLDEWKEAWLLGARWHNATLEQLKKDLTGLHGDCKVMALAICASAIVERPDKDEPLRDLGICTSKKGVTIPDVPEDLMPLIAEALKDSNPRVRLAAAIFHYTIQAGNEVAREIMLHTLHNGKDADSWAAAQCLAFEGNGTFPVIKRLLTQMFEVESKAIEEQVCLLLIQLSEGTNLVHTLLADRLNSSNWKDRILACRALSRIHGHATQDMKNKLVHLMWNDWSSAVRQAAAQVLGRMGLGIVVHNQLREKLERGDSRTRVEALCMIGWLKLMTAKLLPGFLQCFSDDFVAVRREACNTSGILQIRDQMVLQCLFKLMQSDPVWKIKVFAIRALGQIGQASEKLKDLLLWAIHYEEEPGVRMQACRSIVALQLRDLEVQTTLQDRLVLDQSELVRREVSRALYALNISPEGNQKEVQDIQRKLNRLCQKDVVIKKLMKLDEVVKKGRQKALKLILDDYDNGSENMASLLGAVFSDRSRASTRMTSTSEAELQALTDNPSRPATQSSTASQEALGNEETQCCSVKQLTAKASKKPLRVVYQLRSMPKEQTTS